MLNNIAIIIGLFVLLVLGVFIIFFIRNKRALRNVKLTAIIDIYPSANASVEFNPYSDISEVDLMRIALLYAAKIRWILDQEKEYVEIVKIYKDFVHEIVTPTFLDPLERPFIEKLSNLVASIQSQKEFSSTTKDGERFIVRLIEIENTWFINNKLPFRPMIINMPISVILLINAVAMRLSEDNVKILAQAFLSLGSIMFAPNTPPKLSNLNSAALECLDIGKTSLEITETDEYKNHIEMLRKSSNYKTDSLD